MQCRSSSTAFGPRGLAPSCQGGACAPRAEGASVDPGAALHDRGATRTGHAAVGRRPEDRGRRLLDRPEEIDSASARFDGVSPISYALAQADRENLDYVVVAAGATLRLYPAKPGVGTGRRGRSETFVEVNLDLLLEEASGYLWLLLSAPALINGGSVADILARSEDYAADLGSRLRERVYREVVPSLSRAAVLAMAPESPTLDDLREAYQVALRILYRLLFVAYAEDRDLLPLHTSRSYREHSLKRIAQRLGEARRKGVEFGGDDFYWAEVAQIWKAINRGNAEWEVPAYNGTLFASEPAVSELGARIAGLSLPDREFGRALAALLLDQTAEEQRVRLIPVARHPRVRDDL